MAEYTSNGGGATHIAKVTGQLKDLSSNLSDILMVSGGGGGGLLCERQIENVYHGESNVSGYNFVCPYDGYYIFQSVVSCENRTPTIDVSTTGTVIIESCNVLTAWDGWKEIVFKCNAGDNIIFTVNSNGMCRMINIFYTPYRVTQLLATSHITDTTLSISYILPTDRVICTQGVVGANTCELTKPQVTDGSEYTVNNSGYRCKWSISDISPKDASFTANTRSYNHGANLYCIYEVDGSPTILSSGKEAGGISGSGDNSADQSTGNAFGQGESGTNVSGGGAGLYGGYKGTSSKSGGAGSGYIGNSLVSNKKMVGYNVPTSSAEGTKTESVNDVSASAVSGKPKSGNGFAKIKLVQELVEKEYRLEELYKTSDLSHYKADRSSNWTASWSNLSQYWNTDWNLSLQQMQNAIVPSRVSSYEYVYQDTRGSNDSYYAFPLDKTYLVKKIEFSIRKPDNVFDNANAGILDLFYCDGSSFAGAGSIIVRKKNGGDITDANYHTFELSLSTVKKVNYVCIAFGWMTTYFKDIKITVFE